MSSFPMRPSYMDVTLNCGASVDLPQIDVETSYASEGTEAHLQCKQLLQFGPNCKLLSPDPHVMEFVNFCRDLQRKTENWHVEIPRRHATIQDLGGTADFVCYYTTPDGKNTLHIVDYKHGMGQSVLADDNAQMLAYATLWMTSETSQVLCTIIQPRDFHRHLDSIRTAEYTVAEVRNFESLIVDQLTNMEYKPGPHCKKCSSMPWCDNVLSLAEELL